MRYYTDFLPAKLTPEEKLSIKRANRARYSREWRKKNPDKARELSRKNRAKHIESWRERAKNYRQRNKEKIRERERKYVEKNRDKLYRRHKRYRLAHPEKFKKSRAGLWKKRLERDPNFRLINAMRCRIVTAMRCACAKKSADTMRLVGCSPGFLKRHIESQFLPGMSWENYGHKTWHVDHIVPVAAFDMHDPVQQLQCFNYSNLQPLWAVDNLRKNARRI